MKEIKPGDEVNLPWFLRNQLIRNLIIKVIKPDLLSVNYKVNEKTIDSLLEKKYPIFLWAPDTRDDLKWALDKHSYGVITDEPLLGKELRNTL